MDEMKRTAQILAALVILIAGTLMVGVCVGYGLLWVKYPWLAVMVSVALGVVVAAWEWHKFKKS